MVFGRLLIGRLYKSGYRNNMGTIRNHIPIPYLITFLYRNNKKQYGTDMEQIILGRIFEKKQTDFKKQNI